MAVRVEVQHCPQWDMESKSLTVDGRVVVRPGPLPSNGPHPLDLDAWVSDERSAPGTTMLGVSAEDPDGFVDSVEIDWGDGSPRHLKSTSPKKCRAADNVWPSASPSFGTLVPHDSPAGTHVARVTARSSGCDGLDEQVKTVEVKVG